MSDFFNTIFDDGSSSVISVGDFFLCVVVALLLGVLYFFAYSYKNRSSKSFNTAVAFLPAVVCVVIMMVNGNIGVGVAVAGAFSLVRFRSAQGSAKEIVVIFMTMCTGLIAGVGYLAYSALFTIVMCALILLSNIICKKVEKMDAHRTLKITIPEDLDYTDVFDEIFAKYLKTVELTSVKTSNLGSLFKLSYDVELKQGVSEKELIDKLRVRNGNLEISLLKTPKESDL